MGPRAARNIAKAEGQYLAVMRPQDSLRAVARYEEIVRQQEAMEISPLWASHLFNTMLEDQLYRYIGALSVNRKYILDPDTGSHRGKVEPGDSFIGWHDIELMSKQTPGKA